MSALMRALSSMASTSVWYNGVGLLRSRMPACAVYVRCCWLSSARTTASYLAAVVFLPDFLSVFAAIA
jgi:hypothetical protein